MNKLVPAEIAPNHKSDSVIAPANEVGLTKKIIENFGPHSDSQWGICFDLLLFSFGKQWIFFFCRHGGIIRPRGGYYNFLIVFKTRLVAKKEQKK